MRYAHGRDYADGPRTTISRQLAPQVRKRVVFGRRRPESTRDNNRVGGGIYDRRRNVRASVLGTEDARVTTFFPPFFFYVRRFVADH